MTDMATEERREVEFVYPLERITMISNKLGKVTIPLLNGFKEFYDLLEIKPIDISLFKKNNFKHYGGQRGQRVQNGWKRKNRFRGKDIEKFLTNTYIKQLPQNDVARIRKTIISNLNKLNDKKFTIIVKEFIDNLEEQMFSETFEILNNEILNKVFDDNHYIYLYSKLVKELIINKKWQMKMFNIIAGEDGEKQYYWTLNNLAGNHDENEYVGPFQTEQEALEDAMEHHNYKISFCSFMEAKFNERILFQNEIASTNGQFDLNIYAKNKYNNFLRFIFTGVEQGVFSIAIVNFCLIKLLEMKEIDQFAFMFELLQGNTKLRLNGDAHNFYETKLNSLLAQTSVSPKTRFKLQEYFKLKLKNVNQFDVLAAISPEEEIPQFSPVIPKRDSKERDIECIISEYPLNNNYKAVKELFENLSEDLYDKFSSKYIVAILECKEDEIKLLVDLIVNLWRDFKNYSESFGKFVSNNLINLYAEYEIDYPICKVIFLDLIKDWLERSGCDKEAFLQELRSKNVDDEDEQYNIDLFNEQIVNVL